MFKIRFSRYFSLLISFCLLVAPLPLSAIAQEIAELEIDNIIQNSGVTYIDLSERLSNIADVISQLSDIDEQNDSPLHELHEHIKNGFSYIEYGAFFEVLEYAESVIQRNYKKLAPEILEQTITDLTTIIEQAAGGSLTMTADVLRDKRLRTLIVNENLDVLGKTTLYKHLHGKEGAHFHGHLKVGKSAKFKNNVKIKGNLVVEGDVSVTDLSVNNLSVVDLTVLSCMDSLCVNNLSVVDCISNLCVNNLSVVNESVSGTLSVNNAIIQNANIANLTVTATVLDSVINNLTVYGTASINDALINNATITNLSVTDCIANLCVDNLSVNNTLRLEGVSGYVGLQAPATVPSSYTLTLPATPPTANQVLSANAITPTNLEWVAQSGGGSSVLPVISRIIYVTTYGNDSTGDGSFNNPYASLAKAISLANTLSSSIDPITISINPGVYVENNNVGPLTITADGISIVGDSASSVIIIPNTPTNDLLLINNTILISNITLESFAPLASGIVLTAGSASTFNNVSIFNFLVGISCSGGLTDFYLFNNCFFASNGIAINADNTILECNNINIFGSSLASPSPANTGIVFTGSSSNSSISSSSIALCATGIDVTGNATTTIIGTNFKFNNFDVIQTGASQMTLSGCTFELTTGSSNVEIQVSGAGTSTEIVGCEFVGLDSFGVPEGTAILVTDNASVNISGGIMQNYTTALQVGISSDTSSTQLAVSALVVHDCTVDILQQGSTTLNFNAGTATSSKISINDATNVTLAFFDLDTGDALTIGSLTDKDTTLVQAAITPVNNPEINYYSSLYSTKAIGFDNSLMSGPSSWFMLSNGNADLTAITTDRTQIAGLQLYSDEGSPVGGTSALRGWNVQKNGSAAALSFNYQNSDIVGQIAIPQYTVMQLDGFNNQLQLPTVGTQIVFDGDTNLYRSSANVLKTDDNFIVGTLTPGRVVITDPVTNELESSITTSTELGFLSGVTSSVQTQLNSKVNRSGDTMTGPLSATDIVVTNLTATNFSSTDAIIQNATINILSVTDFTAQNIAISNVSIVDGTVTGTLSVNDQIVQNISATHLSATDAIIQNGTIVNFSSTDAIVQNATITNISSNDAVIQNLTVNNCISNLCVNNLSVVNESVSGTLSINDAIVDNFLRFENTAGTAYVGLQAPSVVPVSYTVSLPSAIPTANQVLQANPTTPTNLQWATLGGMVSPSLSETIYVAKYGNDITGNGSFDLPYLTLSKAISVANGIASALNPIIIMMLAGIYVENNSAGPLAITSDGISIVGDSANGVIIIPNTPTNDLLLINNTILISNITLESSAPLASGIVLTTGSASTFNDVSIFNFLVGISCSGGVTDFYLFNNCFFASNGTALSVNNVILECNNINIFGSSLTSPSPANTGIVFTGSNSNSSVSGSSIALCTTGIEVTGNATTTINSTNFKFNSFDVVQTGASKMTLSGCTFELTTGPSDIEVQVSGAGTSVEIVGCEFGGFNSFGVAEGTAIVVSDNAVVNIGGGSVHDYTTGVQVGLSTDTSSTSLAASALVIRDCTTDILQEGSATLNFNAGTATSAKISINDATNVTLAFFDLDTGDALTIGSLIDQDTTLIQAAITLVNNPEINYYSSLYSTQAIGFDNSLLSNPSTWFMLSNANADLAAITTDRTQIAGLQLYSDTGSPIGGTSALRGWDLDKNSSTAELSCKFKNSDIGDGQPVTLQYTIMQLDGFNNQLQLPTAGTQIIFDGDTNLYRSGVGVLQTDDNFVVGTLIPGNVVITDLITNQLSSSDITAAELEFLSGAVASIQVQLNGKVNKSGDTMTGTLELPAGTTASPSLVFSTGSSLTGLSASGDTLSFSNMGVESMNIDSSGVVTIDGFTTAGVVHNNASGNLSSSLIVNGDITVGTIANNKLATISNLDIPGDIVVRDVSGNFATNKITIDGSVTNPTDAATKAYVDAAISTGLSAHTPAVVVSVTNVALTGLQTIDGVALNANDRVLLVGQTNPVENGLWEAEAGAWIRPADFATGTQAGQAYVLILEGTVYEGSSWLCTTPLAIIDTDPIEFSLFTLPNTTVGANVGVGTGLVYQGKTGVTLNFRTLLDGDIYTVITTGANEVSIGTNATNLNTASTIVARDASGNFSASTITANLIGNVTGHASLDLPLTGGTLTGTLTVPAGTAAAPSIQFTGSTNTGISAATANTLSFDTSGVERMNISSTGVTIDAFTTAGVVHNSAAGLLSSSLIVNADVDPAAAIVDTKLATITTAGKVANSATTATNFNNPNTIVLRDASGNFVAGTIMASLTGAASLNVLKAGDTMTGTLQLPAGTTALPSLTFTGSTTTGLSANTDDLSFSTSGVERMEISSGGTVSIDGFTVPGVVHNDASGNLSSSLIVDADVSPTAAIQDTKLATITTAGKVANSATTATSLNNPNTIVLRDGSGNFAAGTITANLNGNATTATTATTTTNFTGSLSGDVTGTQSATVVSFVGGQTAANVAAATVLANAATNLNTPNTIVKRDASGNFAAGTITANLIGNVTGNVSGSAGSFTGSLAGDVTGTQGATVVSFVGGQTAANVAAATVLANAATSANTPNTIVKRDASGNFSAGIITASLNGNATTATTATNFSGSLAGDVTGTQGATVVSFVGGQTAANVASATIAANAATSLNTPNTIVKRDASGNFAAGTIIASLTGAASLNVLKAGDTMTGTLQLPAGTTALPSLVFTGSTTAGLSANSGNLSFSTNGTEQMKISSGGIISIDGFTIAGVVHNDSSGNLSSSLIVNADISATAGIIDTKLATISTAGKVANSATTATSLNTPNTIVLRDGSGNFSAGTITANLNGNATTATSSGSFSGSLAGDVTGTQGATVVSFVGGQTAANVAAATVLANAATNLNTPNTIVKRDASGNFSAGTITANLNGNATTATTATNFSGSLAGDVTGTQGATVVSFVGGQTAANVAAATVLANAATNLNTANTIVKRDASGNFAAGTITASLNGNATTATTATNFSGSLAGDVTGTQGATVVSFVGGQTAANVAAATVLANAATNLNTPNTIVKRDASGNFSAGTITANLNGNATTATSATTATTATNFTGSLAGDVTGTQGATVVSLVGGQTAANVAAATVLANAATSANTPNTIVKRDASGNFSAGTITANLNGNATTATTATNFSGSLAGDVTGTQGATVVSLVGGQTAANVAAATVLANAATSANTPNTIVKRDASGNFSAGTITANLNGNATTATTATNFSGSLAGDVTGTQGATVVSLVGGQTAANVAAATVLANAATSANTPNTIVKRDASGNFAAGTITASLTGHASLDLPLTGGTLTGTLTLPAGSAAAPSLQFTGSTNTGISAATANTLSFDTNGVERMSISTINIIQDIPLCNQAIQQFTVTANNQSVAASATTSVLLLQTAANRTGLTITFPPSPVNGQYFTILLGATNSITVTNVAGTGGAAIVNAITTYSSTLGAAATTYFYYAPSNAWYRERTS